MALRIPSYTELQKFVVGVGRSLLSTRDWSINKTAWKWFGAVNAGIATLFAHLTQAKNDLLPDSANEPYLSRWGKMRAKTAKPATPARGTAALRVTGTPGSVLAITNTLTHLASGLRFKLNEAEVIPAGGSVDVDVIAIDTGKKTRLTKDEVLTFDAPPAGVNEQAVIVVDLTLDGDDAEAIEAYRGRILDTFRRPPLGGAPPDYEQWATEVTGIAAAYTYPTRPGLGAVDLVGLHDGRGAERILSAGEVTELQTYVAAKKPVGAEFRVLTVEGINVDVEVLVEPVSLPEYVFDWNDQVALVILTWTLATRKIVFTTNRPSSMLVGHRLTIKPIAGGGTGQQYVIEALDGANGVILEEVPATAPAPNDTVYSGGALVDPVRDGVLEHFDELGPTNPDASPYGSWEGNVRPENIYAIAQGTAGVRRSTVSAPAVTVAMVDSPYPDDGKVFLAIPRRILVRRLW